MNSRILNKVILQSLRHSYCRYLSVQQNIIKFNSVTCHSVNFRRGKENRTSSFIFTKLNNNVLCQSSLPVYTCHQRNLSGKSQSNELEDFPQLKPLDDVGSSKSNVSQDSANSITQDLSENQFVDYVQQLLLQIHEGTGLPWWATIALTALLIRTTIVLPFSVTQIRQMAKIESVNMKMENIDIKLKRETVRAIKEYGWPENLAGEKYKEAKINARWNLFKKENCHPMKAYLPMSIQLITWIVSSSAVYTLCNPNYIGPHIHNEMTTGGFGWITDLTAIDPYLVLPLSLALVNLCIVEVHHSFKVLRRTSSEQWKCAFFRVVSIATLPMAAYTPAALNIYWLSSSLYGLIQVFILNSSLVRRVFRIPMNDAGLKHPYQYFLKNTKEKLRIGKGESVIATQDK